MSTANGVRGFCFEYRSVFDDAPCVAILSLRSGNTKTGDMIQSWFLRRDVPPTDALKTGDDASICGDCPHRPASGGSCYVTVFRAPLAVWKAYHAGSYVKLDLDDPDHVRRLRSKPIRFGAYGEATSVPLWYWERFFFPAVEPNHWTGYTHQWRREDCQGFRSFLMASVDSEAEKREANAMGWRTFRVRREDEDIADGEFSCPAAEESGKRLTCETCRACRGLGLRDRAPTGNVTILAHGQGAKRFAGTQKLAEFVGVLST